MVFVKAFLYFLNCSWFSCFCCRYFVVRYFLYRESFLFMEFLSPVVSHDFLEKCLLPLTNLRGTCLSTIMLTVDIKAFSFSPGILFKNLLCQSMSKISRMNFSLSKFLKSRRLILVGLFLSFMYSIIENWAKWSEMEDTRLPEVVFSSIMLVNMLSIRVLDLGRPCNKWSDRARQV